MIMMLYEPVQNDGEPVFVKITSTIVGVIALNIMKPLFVLTSVEHVVCPPIPELTTLEI